jgi:hypothetical protein
MHLHNRAIPSRILYDRPRLGGRLTCLAGVSALALVLAAPQPARAQRGARGVEVENVRVGFDASIAEARSANSFKVGAWTPVWVQLRGGTEGFSGFMEVVVGDDDGTPGAFRMPVAVGANKSERFTAYARPGSREPEFTVRLLDARGRRVGGASQSMAMPVPPDSIMPYENLILTMGRPQGVEAIAQLPGFKGGAPSRSNSGLEEIVTARIDTQGGSVPGRWYGYDGARAIVVDTGDKSVLSALEGLRGQAIVDWVARGGHVVVAVGANWQAVRDSVLGPMLPGLPSGQEQLASLEALDIFAGSSKSITPPGTKAVMVTTLEGVKERGGKVLSVMSSLPLVVRGSYGFGRVTLLTFDVDQNPFARWPDRSQFWVRAIDLRRPKSDQSGVGLAGGGGRPVYQNGITDLSTQLRAALEDYPGVKLIPFGWVAFFIFLYILLIGPGDYFFLKKVLKRMELTWITFPTIVLTVSLVAYYAAYLLKGNDLLVNKVDIVDVDQQTGLQRGLSLVSLFSPQNRDYSIAAIPLPLDRDAPAEANTSAESADSAGLAGTEMVVSWFSAPENQFAAMGSSGRRFNFGGDGYSYQPTGDVKRIDGVRIPIWSTKCIMARWFGPAAPLVDAELQSVGTERLSGTVTNRQSVPLEDAILAFGKKVYLLGTLEPGATKRVELSNDRNLDGHLDSKVNNYLSDQTWNHDKFKINRPDLLTAIMFHDSESAVGNERALSNAPLQNIDLTGQLLLQRPMLVARFQRPGARLALENAPSPPKIDQLTMVRIILPLKTP